MKKFALRAAVALAAIVLLAGDSFAGPIRNMIHRHRERVEARVEARSAEACPCEKCECKPNQCPAACPATPGVSTNPTVFVGRFAPQSCPTCVNGNCPLPRR